MVITSRQHCYSSLLLLVCLITLTGCPGDRWRPDEETTVSVTGDNICFSVPNAEDYQPVNIAINPRGTPSREKAIIFNPALRVVNDQLCVPPSFYAFPENGQFIVSYVLHSEHHKKPPRRMMSGVEIANGCVFNIPLTDREISRPYGEKRDLPEDRKVYCK
ncbi:putative T6SS immunity periplasmic lipoprotein [Erwinia sp. CGal63]|uniref:putative T6SS immunity periplasmic lipoprotein n=1 Tax=Erwinia sp. CGal63 TaxID=2919889 RepID=UPI003009BAC8